MEPQRVELPRRTRRIPQGSRPRRVLVCGPPNTGKTSLFNRLAGARRRVGNYPGVTVEGASARVDLERVGAVELVDLPGTYSLCGRGAEERIAIAAILGLQGQPQPDALLVVTAASELEHNLYLPLQIAELGLPTLLVLNMADEAQGQGVDVDVAAVAEVLGVPVVATSARTGGGLDDLLVRLAHVLESPDGCRSTFATPLPEVLATAADTLAEELPEDWRAGPGPRPRPVALWALMSLEEGGEEDAPPALVARVEGLRADLQAARIDVDRVIAESRHGWIDAHLLPLVSRASRGALLTDRLDSVLIHPAAGFVIFLALMTVLFQGLFTWSDPAIGLIEAGVGLLGRFAGSTLPDGLFRDFVTDGLIAGVGGVVVFLPQILLLFLLLGLMEDSGYMARVACLMDRIMRSVGLHGRAFVPLLSGFACAVPAILATRTMERRRDRLLTMMVVPLTMCSARLPVYTLIIAVLVPVGARAGGVPVQGLMLAAMYIFSIVTALVAAAVLGRTVLKGRHEPLVLELPPYRLPRATTVLRMMWDRSGVFLKQAGSVILVCTVILWALLSFPRIDPAAPVALDADPATVQMNASYGASLGHALEPVIEPLGFDWKIGVGLIGAFAAREVFVATMGVVYGVGDEVDETSDTLRERIAAERWPDGRPVYTPLVGVSLMVFFAIAMQCMSTLAVVYRETKSWRWPLFMVTYMTALAWLASFAVYQGGRLLGFG